MFGFSGEMLPERRAGGAAGRSRRAAKHSDPAVCFPPPSRPPPPLTPNAILPQRYMVLPTRTVEYYPRARARIHAHAHTRVREYSPGTRARGFLLEFSRPCNFFIYFLFQRFKGKRSKTNARCARVCRDTVNERGSTKAVR